MIRLENASYANRDETRRTVVLDRVSGVFPAGRRVALLGANGAGKTTLLKLLSRSAPPDSGRVIVRGSVSWPVGFTGGFASDMTGADNVRFLARLHGRDPESLVGFVERFADIGAAFWAPWRTYSSGQRSRVSMGASLGIPFDTYLIDEATSVGDAAFRAKADAYLKDRLANAGAVIVSHSNETIRNLCDYGAVLHRGALLFYESVEDAVRVHEENLRAPTRAA